MESAAAVEAGTAARESNNGLVVWTMIAAIATLIAALFFDVMLDLASDWWNLPEASYGMLVPPTALYIAYLQRKTTFAYPAQPTLRGLWMLALGCLLFLTGKLAGEFFLARISIVFVLAGVVWTFWGSRRLANTGLSPCSTRNHGPASRHRVQRGCGAVTTVCIAHRYRSVADAGRIRLSGWKHHPSGEYVARRGGSLQRLALFAGFGGRLAPPGIFGRRYDYRTRSVASDFRPAGDRGQRDEGHWYRTSGRLSAGTRHGILPLIFGMAGLRLRFWRVMADRAIVIQVDAENRMKTRSPASFPLPLMGTLLLLATTLAASKLTEHRRTDALVRPLDSIARNIQGFVGSENPPLNDHVLGQLKCSSYLSRNYVKQGAQADLFIAYYAQQRAGESMHSPKHCLPGSGWEIWDYGRSDIQAAGRSVEVNKYSIENGGDRRLVLYWYQSKGRIIASEYMGKILLARDALLQNSTAASIVRIIVPDQPGALDYARGFASELIPQVQHSFGE